jgi:hypothetical protein
VKENHLEDLYIGGRIIKLYREETEEKDVA